MKMEVETEKFVIQDDQGRLLWGMTRRSGVHFDHEFMPQFWKLNDKTKLFSSREEANDFAVENNIGSWTKFKIIPVTNKVIL